MGSTSMAQVCLGGRKGEKRAGAHPHGDSCGRIWEGAHGLVLWWIPAG